MENKHFSIPAHLQSDQAFDQIYPPFIRLLGRRHWTPLHVVQMAVDFLKAKPGTRILDIGSGAGKFCLAGASYAPGQEFFGIEQRSWLIEHANEARNKMGLSNVHFIEGNFTQLDLRKYDHFYFFNSFYENIDSSGRIDERIEYSASLYNYYIRYLYNQLKGMPSGCRIVTYHTLWDEIPREYRLMDTLENGALSFWIRR